MPHISKKKVSEGVYLKIHDDFVDAIIRLKNKKRGRDFFDQLLTPTEKVMLAKRLAIIVMLSEGHSIYRIQYTLKVSPSTVARIMDKVDKKEFSSIQMIFMQKKEREAFWKSVEILLQAGMPPRGKGRLKWLLMDKMDK